MSRKGLKKRVVEQCSDGLLENVCCFVEEMVKAKHQRKVSENRRGVATYEWNKKRLFYLHPLENC